MEGGCPQAVEPKWSRLLSIRVLYSPFQSPTRGIGCAILTAIDQDQLF